MSILGEVKLKYPIASPGGQIDTITLRAPDLDDMISVEVETAASNGSSLAGIKALLVRVSDPVLTPPQAGKLDPRDMPAVVKVLGPFFAAVNGGDE